MYLINESVFFHGTKLKSNKLTSNNKGDNSKMIS